MARTISARATAWSSSAVAGGLARTSAAARRRAHEALSNRGPTIAPRRHGSRVQVHGGKIARLAEHLVDLAGMDLLGVDHLPGVLLQHHGAAFHQSLQFL